MPNTRNTVRRVGDSLIAKSVRRGTLWCQLFMLYCARRALWARFVCALLTIKRKSQLAPTAAWISLSSISKFAYTCCTSSCSSSASIKRSICLACSPVSFT